mmetsp:Transcript_2087/g.4853  ORF Transcript_2087/g.4853 Transcript_2087/m.4853 type:complete len:268 (-) Transcript_2087:188-991(-)
MARLAVGLHHPERIGNRVRDDGRHETNAGVAPQLLPKHVVVLRDHLLQSVVRREPRVVTNKSRGGGCQCAVPEDGGPFGAALRKQDIEPGLALNLHDRLYSVDRCDENPPSRCATAGADGLHCCWQSSRGWVGFHQRHDAGVRGGVAESRQRALRQRGPITPVEPQHAPLAVERFSGLAERHAVPVLVVHDRSNPHQRGHLHHHGPRAGDAAPERALPRTCDDLAQGLLLLRATCRLRFGHLSSMARVVRLLMKTKLYCDSDRARAL